MVMLGRGQVCRVLVGDGTALGAQRVEGVAEVVRGPQDGGVGHQCQAQRLVDLVVEVTAPDVTLVGEEQIAPQEVSAGIRGRPL